MSHSGLPPTDPREVARSDDRLRGKSGIHTPCAGVMDSGLAGLKARVAE
jgi:hypothetical protein